MRTSLAVRTSQTCEDLCTASAACTRPRLVSSKLRLPTSDDADKKYLIDWKIKHKKGPARQDSGIRPKSLHLVRTSNVSEDLCRLFSPPQGWASVFLRLRVRPLHTSTQARELEH